MVKVEIGQTVIVWDGHGRAKADPIRGTVVKIGRVWIDVHREGVSWGWRFRLDTQTDGSRIGSPARFYTLDQWAAHQLEDAAVTWLREQGITIEWHSKVWARRHVELAKLIGWTPPGA